MWNSFFSLFHFSVLPDTYLDRLMQRVAESGKTDLAFSTFPMLTHYWKDQLWLQRLCKISSFSREGTVWAFCKAQSGKRLENQGMTCLHNITFLELCIREGNGKTQLNPSITTLSSDYKREKGTLSVMQQLHRRRHSAADTSGKWLCMNCLC